MSIWLKGTGRTNEELSRILQQSNAANDPFPCYRRSNRRHQLSNAHGELIFMKSKLPCQVLDISAGGCSLRTEKPFRPGALASVEVFLPILGMVLHIGGETQWVKNDRHMGVQFTHVNSGSRYQVECLVDCLRGLRTVEFVKASVASRELALLIGEVLAVQPSDTSPANSHSAATQQAKLGYDPLVHCGEGRFCSLEDDEWLVVLQSPSNGVHFTGAIVDLSPAGCTVRTSEPFKGLVDEPVEVRFDLLRHHLLLSCTVRTIHDPYNLGIHFNSMSDHKRKGLQLLLEDLCDETHTQLEVG